MRNVRIGRALFIGCLLGLLLVVLVITAPAANAQVCPAWVDQVSCLQQDAYNIIHNARRQNRANQAVANLENLIFRGGYYGYYDGGIFNPVYDRYGRPMGRREKVITGAGIGAAIGGGVGSLIGKGHPGAGTAIGAGGGALVGLLLSRRGGSASAGPSAGGGQGDFELSNSTRFPVDVYLRYRDKRGITIQKEKFLGRLPSGEAWAVKAPKLGESYHGYVLIPNHMGGLSSDHLYPAPTQNGWEFVEPPEAIAQGGTR